ncbi:MAG: 1-phosphofructokinase family hexose kinase [Clostridia bacterium]|nr:1-phosphofructokinase family hexose kinase [Clostridia bacterium]
MIATVTANPCVDKTVTVPAFDLYRMNRVRVISTDLSGKGINVSKVLRALGAETLCTGFDFCEGDVSPLATDLERDGIAHDLIRVPGALRVCTKIFDESRKHTIEVNERGKAVTSHDGERLLAKIVEVAKRSDFLTLSGSLPQGLDNAFYARCMQQLRLLAPDCRIVVDGEGELLRMALDAAPYLIKPNIHEFESTFACKIDRISQLDQTVQELFGRYGVEMICVSLGEKGAYLATRGEAYVADPVQVEVRSLQGAGDSMVAGICMAAQQGMAPADMLRFGVAAAGATISTAGTRPGSKADFEMLLHQAKVQKIR